MRRHRRSLILSSMTWNIFSNIATLTSPTECAVPGGPCIEEQIKNEPFNGRGLPKEAFTILLNDLATGTVITLPVTLPAPLALSSAIYDPQSGNAYVFGGEAYEFKTKNSKRAFREYQGAYELAEYEVDSAKALNAMGSPDRRRRAS